MMKKIGESVANLQKVRFLYVFRLNYAAERTS